MKANNNRIKCDKPPVPQNNDDIIKLCSSNKDDLCKRFAKETSGEIICSNPVDKKDDDIISPGSSEKKGIGKNTSGNICKDTISNSEVEHHEGKSNQSTPTQLDSHTENAFKVEQDGMENNTKTSNPPIKQMTGADQTNDKQITQDNPTSKDKKKSKKKRKQNILVRPPRMTSAML